MPKRRTPRLISGEKNVEMVKGAASRLAEHNDSVIVITTRDINGQSSTVVSVKGNVYAARDSARQFLNTSAEHERQSVRMQYETDDDS